MSQLAGRRTSAAAVPLLLSAVLALGGCGDEDAEASPGTDAESTASASTESPSPSSSPSASTEPAEPTTFETTLAGYDIQVRADANRFRFDGVALPRLHLLPVDVATDPEAERWGDLFLLAPTKVYDPKTQKPQPLPAQPVRWLETNPTVEVLQTKELRLDGRPAWQVDAKRDGSELFGDESGGLEGDGYERFVLWKVGTTWFLGQAGTFRGEEGLTAPDEKDDAFMSMLRSAKFVATR